MDARVVSQRKGRIELDVRLSPAGVLNNGIYMRVEAVNPANPLRNIRVLLPDMEALSDDGMPFHPVRLASDYYYFLQFFTRVLLWNPVLLTLYLSQRFLNNMRNYSALRFMDWTDLESPAVTWEARAVPADARWNARGVPIEVMVHLCNILGSAPWFVVSDAADDAYVASMAALVRDTLRPDVPVRANGLRTSVHPWALWVH